MAWLHAHRLRKRVNGVHRPLEGAASGALRRKKRGAARPGVVVMKEEMASSLSTYRRRTFLGGAPGAWLGWAGGTDAHGGAV